MNTIRRSVVSLLLHPHGRAALIVLRVALALCVGLTGCGVGALSIAHTAVAPTSASPGTNTTTTTTASGSTGSSSSNGGTTSGGSTSGGSTVNVSASQQAAIASTTNFGDSITAGWGSSAPQLAYAALLDAAIASPNQNLSRPGDQAADMARLWVYPNAAPSLGGAQLYSVMIGINDAYLCGGSEGCLANWRGSLAASLAWLAVPSADKVLGNSIGQQGAGVRSGSWTADLKDGIATTDAGATLSFPVQQVQTGRSLLVAYRVFDAGTGGGEATLSIDGQPVATLSASVTTGEPIDTKNGTTDTIFLVSVPLGEAGLHNVTLTTTAAGFFSLQWAGVSSGNYAHVAGAPRVLIGQITGTGSAALNVTVNQYNAELAQLVAALAAEGLNIQIVPTANVLQPGDFSDELHPNDAGHLLLAQTFAASL